jgi:hypothetical protein
MATGLFNLKQVNQAISQGAWSGYIAPRWVEYLVVAGGGSGGRDQGGGGGAGGLLTGIVTVATGASYTVTIGAGGAGITSGAGNTGVSSVFGSITTLGGGGGGAYTNPASSTNIGKDGGSGGGGGGSAGAYQPGGNGTAGQGNAGGRANNNNTFGGGGGGGGAGTVGLDAINATSTPGGNGGAGIASAITGTVVTYAGGGGGNKYDYPPGAGGVGGGGSASNSLTVAGGNGATNTGGGGGGIWNNGGSYPSGAGGSGIVVVRYPGNVVFFTGGTVNYNNGYIIHIFTASGTLAPTTPTVYNTSYQISRSLRFNSADSAYLNRTFAGAGNRTTWTWSGWIKFSSSATQQIFVGGADVSNRTYFLLNSEKLGFYTEGANTTTLITTQVFRDYSAWYHIVYAVDTTQATASNRIKLYVNGVQVTAFDTATYQNQNTDTNINGATTHYIGTRGFTNEQFFNGYMTEVNFVNAQQLTPSSFGATSTTTGVWSPIQYTGTYGTNGFYLNFSDNSNTTAATLGKDYSGNGNNWTPNNFSVTAGAGNDSMVDSPTQYGFDTGVGGTVRGNYCTLNPLTTTAGTYTQGNLRYTGANAFRRSNATVSVATGKWYWEVTLGNAPYSGRDATSANNAFGFGLSTVFNSTTDPSLLTDAIVLADNAYYKNFSGAYTDTTVTFSSGDVLSIAVDLDGNTFTLRRNNTSLATGTIGGTAGRELVPIILSYAGTYGVMDCNFGQRPFAYTAPSGFKALCTQNLPTPTIGATSNSLANQFFNPVLYTGTGATQSITVGFQPDFTWFKVRNQAYGHALFDSIRGAGNGLQSNNTNAEAAWGATTLTAFTSTGLTLGADTSLLVVNSNANTFVAWNWKAGNNAGASNSSGSITSTVSVNTTSGFSIVKYTGTSTAATVGHGLGVAPAMVIYKLYSAVSNWIIYHIGVAPTSALQFNTDASYVTPAFNNLAPTSSVLNIGGASVGTNDGSMLAYCFAPVAGYSAFGSYTGNGSADGPFVYTGFRPAFIMRKNTTNSLNGDNWYIQDVRRSPYNVTATVLAANQSYDEATFGPTNYGIDVLSNGFKIRDNSVYTNSSGSVYIYAAFAENPFKYSLAR